MRVQPAEWASHRAVITAWPEHAYAWGSALQAAQEEFLVFVRTLTERGGEEVWILVGESSTGRARLLDLGPSVRLLDIPYGDVWLRDIAPVFVGEGPNAAVFSFNGWGGKYIYPHDDAVAGRLAERLGLQVTQVPLVSEGGAWESDGQGTYLSTRRCVIDEQRNPGLTQAEIEARVAEPLGARKVLWLDAGLQNDHTDGHIDNIARFVAPGEVVCMRASGEDDPNRQVLEQIEASLRASSDALGRQLLVHTMPSPGVVFDDDGELMPASYLNFYIANRAVIVPAYGKESDISAVATLASLFPTRDVISLPARQILTGGGSFHCITQQVPASFVGPVGEGR